LANTRARVFVFGINNSIETISSLANWMTTDYDVYVESLNHGFPNFKITHSIWYFGRPALKIQPSKFNKKLIQDKLVWIQNCHVSRASSNSSSKFVKAVFYFFFPTILPHFSLSFSFVILLYYSYCYKLLRIKISFAKKYFIKIKLN